jgi:hypothetical protein
VVLRHVVGKAAAHAIERVTVLSVATLYSTELRIINWDVFGRKEFWPN